MSIENYKLQIESIRPWVESETGMMFSGEKFSRLCAAVDKVLGSNRDKMRAELERIFATPVRQNEFLERLTAELTIGESFFLRNENHFKALREHVIPAILRDKADSGEIRVWSAGCATGEEPYSVAILLDMMIGQGIPGQSGGLPKRLEYKVDILGTDLNEQFLDRARQARYRPWSFRQTEIHKDPSYFTLDGKDYCLASRIREQVHFAHLNLVKDIYPSSQSGTLGLDLILFRNVAIYLKQEVTNAIVKRFHRALRPGGWLLLGETEVGTTSSQNFEVHRFDDATLFRKKSDRASHGVEARGNETMPVPVPPLAERRQGQPFTAKAPTVPRWTSLPEVWPDVPSETETSSSSDEIQQFLAEHAYNDAERVISRIGQVKDRAHARLTYVRGLLDLGQLPRAGEMLDKCLEEAPLLIEAQLLKAAFAEESGDLAGAEQQYRRALYMDRKCAIAHLHLALIQRQTGNISGAKRSLEIAVELVRGEDVYQAVPYGDGVCYGRLQEMLERLLDS